jgi:hypothetical protein
MEPSRIRSDKHLGRRHERYGEGRVRRRHTCAAEVMELMQVRRPKKNLYDVPPRTAAHRAQHQTFNQTCSIIHIGQRVPTTRLRRNARSGELFPIIAWRMGNAARAVIGSDEN